MCVRVQGDGWSYPRGTGAGSKFNRLRADEGARFLLVSCRLALACSRLAEGAGLILQPVRAEFCAKDTQSLLLEQRCCLLVRSRLVFADVQGPRVKWHPPNQAPCERLYIS